MSSFWFLVGIELISGQNILKHNDNGLSNVLHSTVDEITKISTVDISDLSKLEQHAWALTRSVTQQHSDVKLALSKLSDDYFWKKISNEEQDKILGFYDVVQQSMSSLTSLSERAYNFYSKQMAENDGFISNTDEMIMIVNDMSEYHSIDELWAITDIVGTFKKSLSDAADSVAVLIDDYEKFKKQTESYIGDQKLQIPQGFLDAYKEKERVEPIQGFSDMQKIMFLTVSIAHIATTLTATPIWPIFAAIEWGLLLQYEYSDERKHLEFELSQTYDNVDNNVQLSFSALDDCVRIMSNTRKELKNIENGLGTLLKQIKKIRRTSNELGSEGFSDGTTRALLRKLKALKNAFERRQKNTFQQNKLEL